MTVLYISHPASLLHDPQVPLPDHPDHPERLAAIEGALADAQLHDVRRLAAPAACETELTLVHSEAHVVSIRDLCQAGGGEVDVDTYVSAASYQAALHAAGGGCTLVRALSAGQAATGFCAVRPGGHHAERDRAMGFCLLNNVSIAAELAIRTLGVRRVMIIDWDVHHGNGTAEIFRHRADVLVANIHQAGLFPGTGATADIGTGDGQGYTVNLPVPRGSAEDVWLSLLEWLIVPIGLEYRPELVLVSAGYDAHEDDPLGECRLRAESFGVKAWWRRSPRSEAQARRTRQHRMRSSRRAPRHISVIAGHCDRPSPVGSAVRTCQSAADAPVKSRSHPRPPPTSGELATGRYACSTVTLMSTSEPEWSRPALGAADIETRRLDKRGYEKELERLQVELVRLQDWVVHERLKVVVVFEGRDTAGKGGTIKRITEKINPRVVRTVALTTPTERERTQWYFQRYVAHLPAAGEIVLFDRSWYNRAGVERVMGFCTHAEYEEFMRTCPQFERDLLRSGIILIKYWLSVSDEEQERRFTARLNDPAKQWKLSGMDLEARRRWVDYAEAKDDMFAYTDTRESPWYVVEADDKRTMRLNLISHLLSLIPYQDLPPEKITLPERQDRAYVRPPQREQNYVPTRYRVG